MDSLLQQVRVALPEDAAAHLVELLGADPAGLIEQRTFVSAALGWWAVRRQAEGTAAGREGGEAGMVEEEAGPGASELGHRLEDPEKRRAATGGGEGSGQEAGRRPGDRWLEADRSLEVEGRLGQAQVQEEAEGGGRQVELCCLESCREEASQLRQERNAALRHVEELSHEMTNQKMELGEVRGRLASSEAAEAEAREKLQLLEVAVSQRTGGGVASGGRLQAVVSRPQVRRLGSCLEMFYIYPHHRRIVCSRCCTTRGSART